MEGKQLLDAICARFTIEGAADEFVSIVSEMNLIDNTDEAYIDKEQAEAQVEEAEKEKAELQQEAEQAKAKAEELQNELIKTQEEKQALVQQSEADKKAAYVKERLIAAGSLDASLAFTALGLDLAAMNFDEGGVLVGVTDSIKALQESKPFLFKVVEPENTHVPSGGGTSSIDDEVNKALEEIGA